MKKKQEAEAPSPKISIKQNVIKGHARIAAEQMVEACITLNFDKSMFHLGELSAIHGLLVFNDKEE